MFGGLDPKEGRMIFFLDTPNPITDVDKEAIKMKHVERDYILDVRMSPATYVSIDEWMNKSVERLKKSGQLKEIKKGVDIPISEGDYYI